MDDCGKIKGILDSYIGNRGKWWNLCMDSWGEIKWKRQDLWWSSKSNKLLVNGAGMRSSGRRVFLFGRNLWALQTVLGSIHTLPTPKQVHELFRGKKNHRWLLKKDQVGWDYTTQDLRLLNCFRDVLTVSCHEDYWSQPRNLLWMPK